MSNGLTNNSINNKLKKIVQINEQLSSSILELNGQNINNGFIRMLKNNEKKLQDNILSIDKELKKMKQHIANLNSILNSVGNNNIEKNIFSKIEKYNYEYDFIFFQEYIKICEKLVVKIEEYIQKNSNNKLKTNTLISIDNVLPRTQKYRNYERTYRQGITSIFQSFINNVNGLKDFEKMMIYSSEGKNEYGKISSRVNKSSMYKIKFNKDFLLKYIYIVNTIFHFCKQYIDNTTTEKANIEALEIIMEKFIEYYRLEQTFLTTFIRK